MENPQDILHMGNISITDYLNEVHVTDDTFLLEDQRHTIEKQRDSLNAYFRLSFIENCEALLSILDTYKFCQEQLAKCRVPRAVLPEDASTSDRPRCVEFIKACRHFSDDMKYLQTPDRYLMHEEVFDKLYCVLTNDLLIIGRQEDEGQKYKLEHTYSRGVLNIRQTHDGLRIEAAGGAVYEIPCEGSRALHFLRVFEEICLSESDGAKSSRDLMDAQLVEYLIMTEQVEELGKYCEKLAKDTENSTIIGLPDIKVVNSEELGTVMRLSGAPDAIFREFATRRFEEEMGRMDRVQPMRGLVAAAFDYLEKFVVELEGVAKETGVAQAELVLCIESLADLTIRALEPRMFGRPRLATEDSRKYLSKRVQFLGYDFSYLLESLEERHADFSRRCVRDAKEEIEAKITEFLR